jgi:hypothetical protein
VDDRAETGCEGSPSRRTSGLAWVLVFLIFLAVVVDMVATMSLGVNANETFRTVPTGRR